MQDATDALDCLLADSTPKMPRRNSYTRDSSSDSEEFIRLPRFKSAVSGIWNALGEKAAHLFEPRHNYTTPVETKTTHKAKQFVGTPLGCAKYKMGPARTMSIESIDKVAPGNCMPSWQVTDQSQYVVKA
ncbi:Oidioi.mRNA.OKI2018_I69.PAR.g10319.t1.cds [Oikopleura dioica]|uniref:Oidioi.mRNA.OKI2018_I69.PAR.g10319.t1.cds n=1 Tax=Oikopleura dioica TaxID=34765 RepID=A0ABN7RUC1_OIKDI|nr:Oidioi.mRNA.OKI2018_I69.PAR.g10319.t1.cds [Oikopleura dioica]